MKKIEQHCAKWGVCRQCEIGRWARNHVFWRGTGLPCQILFVGEGPGRREDRTGFPFVGISGTILDRMIEEANVTNYAITNLVACRPCNGEYSSNRAPRFEEVAACSERLYEFVEMAKPAGIVLVGRMTTRLAEIVRLPRVRRITIDHPSYIARRGGVGTQLYKDAVVSIRTMRKAIPS